MEEHTPKRQSPVVRTTVSIEVELLEWLNETHPGALWKTINGLLRAYKQVFEEKPPIDYYKLGATLLKSQIDSELEEK